MRTYEVPITNHPRPGVEKLLEKVDYYKPVDYRPSGVRGLIVTPVVKGGELTNRWTLTHKPSGRCFPYGFESIAAAKRGARAVADLFVWSDPELLYEMVKPSSRPVLREISARLRPIAIEVYR